MSYRRDETGNVVLTMSPGDFDTLLGALLTGQSALKRDVQYRRLDDDNGKVVLSMNLFSFEPRRSARRTRNAPTASSELRTAATWETRTIDRTRSRRSSSSSRRRYSIPAWTRSSRGDERLYVSHRFSRRQRLELLAEPPHSQATQNAYARRDRIACSARRASR